MVSDLNLEIEELLRSIRSPESHRAIDLLFTATAGDLAKTYKPGLTEKQDLSKSTTDVSPLVPPIDNLKNIPPVLDFEASSLSDCSYPISAGLVVDGQCYYWLIKPKSDWIDWSLASQAIHGIKRSQIEEHGQDADQVCAEIRQALLEQTVIYSDNPYWEQMWLSRLGDFNLEIRDVQELIPSDNKSFWQKSLEKQFGTYSLTQHRADHDALALALAISDLQD